VSLLKTCACSTLSAQHPTENSSFQNADQKQDRNLDSLPAPSGCGPAPTALENPPEMARVNCRIRSIELEIRQDGDLLCFVDRNISDRPGHCADDPDTSQTSSCSHSALRCSLALSVRWRFGIS
jgi:hypothetical protein